MNIELSECPTELQDKVTTWIGKMPSDVIAVTRIETTPFQDKSIIETVYKVYVQCITDIAIFTHIQRQGINLPDIERMDVVNGSDILVILQHASHIKDDVLGLFNRS